MKLVLINPIYSDYNMLKDKNESLHIGLIILQSLFVKYEIECDIVDLNLLYRLGEISIDDNFYINATAIINGYKPDSVGITSMANNYVNVILLAEHIKNLMPDTKIFLGGPQASFVAKETLSKFNFIDFIFRGEGEQVVPDLAKYFLNEKKISDIPSITYRLGNDIKENDEIPNLLPECKIPSIDYSYMREKYNLSFTNKTIAVEGGRGCPRNCVFCSTSKYWKRQFRLKTGLVDEMMKLNKQYGVRDFDITHDLFTLNKARLIEFCNKVSNLGFAWACSSRVDVLDESLIDTMVRSGCYNIFFGIETGDQEFQKKIRKNLNLEYADKVVKYCINKGIKVTVSFIIGFPEENITNINNTLMRILKYCIYGSKKYVLTLLIPEHGADLMLSEKYKMEFYEELYDDTSDSVKILKSREKQLIKDHPNLFNHYYFYEPTQYNFYFIKSISNVFKNLLRYYRRTLWLYTKLKLTEITELIRDFMNWEKSNYFYKDKYEESKNSQLVYDRFTTFVRLNANNKVILDMITYETIMYELNILEESYENEVDDKVYIRENLRLSNFDHNIAEIVEKIKNEVLSISLNSTSLAIGVIENEGNKRIFVRIISNRVSDFLKSNKYIEKDKFLRFYNQLEVDEAYKIKELVDNKFIVGINSKDL